MEKIKLENKVIIIIGGTKGIGKGVAYESARQGAKVIIGGRDANAGKQIVEELKSEKKEAEFLPVDVTRVNEIRDIFSKTFEQYGRIDGVVYYAGVTTAGSIEECSEELYDCIFDTNVKGAFFCLQESIKYMKKTGGSIVLFGSPHFDKGEKDRGAYACSKSALYAMAIHASKHYAVDKIRVNYITTGWTPTEGEVAFRQSIGMDETTLREYAKQFIPMGRMQEVEDHVPAVVFLLSDDSQMITGANIRITGGLYF